MKYIQSVLIKHKYFNKDLDIENHLIIKTTGYLKAVTTPLRESICKIASGFLTPLLMSAR